MPSLPRRSFAGLVVLALALTLAPAPATTPPVEASHTSNPASVTIAGSLQSELGCSADWLPDCAATHLALEAADQVWQGTFNVPAGSWEYKAPLNDSWTENYGAGGVQDGPNIGLNLAAPTLVKFYYDHASHWITDNRNSRIVTAPGDYQSELGCTGDWQPDCLRSWLQDADGDGTYSFTTTALPAGNYETKAALNEGWDENYGQGGAPGGPNIPFTVPANNAPVTFSFVSATNLLTVTSGTTGASHDNNIWWADLGHDSRSTLYRTPGGAVTAGTSVKLRLRAASGDLTAARVRVWNDRTDSQSLLNMSLVADDGTYEWWQASLSSSQPTIFWYRFIAQDGSAMAHYEDDAARTGGWGETLASSVDRSWQLTVYDAGFQTPDWIKDAVIYQIFPDRFRDGNPANNPLPGEFFYNETPTVLRSHGSDWNTPVCDPRASTGPCPGVYSQNFYGGDLAGIISKLDYLDGLGITALYLNPIFSSPSNHKYDTRDFSQIDPAFGDPATFQLLSTEAHNRGIRLILDGVFNHTSSDSIYFDRYGRYPSVGACESASSPHRAWYYFTPVSGATGPCVGDDGTPGGATYESWFGYDSLPKLNATNQQVRDYFYAGGVNAIGPYWLSWADGWRLDVAGDIDQGLTNSPDNDYWEGFRAAVRDANPEAYIVGEEWGMATAWTLGHEWDATMNYQLSSALLSFFRDEPFTDNDHNNGSSAGPLNPLAPSQLSERLLNLQERYPPEAFYALMNLLGSHDTNRPLFMLDHNADQNNRALYENASYDWSDSIARLKGVALLQATLPGAPTVYYGDEVGLVAPPTHDGSSWQDDPYNRIPYPWLDQTGTPFYSHLQTEAGQANLRDHYSLLFNTRSAHPALRTGSLDVLLSNDDDGTFAYGRKMADNSDAAVIAVNRSAEARGLGLDVCGYLPVAAEFIDVLDGNATRFVDEECRLNIGLPPGGAALLVLNAPMAAAPAAVGDLAVSGEHASSIDLDWSAAAGATSYDVYRSLLSGGGYELVANTAGTSFVDTGLAQATSYFYVVRSRDDASRLLSGFSNEASGTAHHDLGDPATSWFNLQWPPTLSHTIGTTGRTDSIYGQIWISGVTEPAGQAAGVRAQVGFGPDGTQPNGEWTWEEMSFNAQAGNNDEYVGSLLPDSVGSFDYATRYSTDNGLTWELADLNGPQRDGALDNPGALTVNASSDSTPPSAPVLSMASVTASSIGLSWSASSDENAVAGYEIFRDGTEIGQVDASTTTYVDESVTTGQTYNYFVRAFDTSFNRSSNSNELVIKAENRPVQVTFRLGVPAYTPSAGGVYVTGSIDALGPWNPGAFAMTEVSPGVWQRTFTIPDGTSFEWKYTRGSWDTVEEWGAITGLQNRGPVTVAYGTTGEMLIDNTATDWGVGDQSFKAVQMWVDPLVVSHSPLAGATDVPVNTTVVVDWSEAMAAGASFSVTGPGGGVAGSFALTNSDTTLTFTPDADLDFASQYDVLVTGQTDAGNDRQQVPTSFSFTTESEPEVGLESITVSPANPTLRKGDSQAFTATGHYSDGSTADLTATASWTTSDKTVVSLKKNVGSAKAVGTAVVSATSSGVAGQSTVIVLEKLKKPK